MALIGKRKWKNWELIVSLYLFSEEFVLFWVRSFFRCIFAFLFFLLVFLHLLFVLDPSWIGLDRVVG